MPISAAKARSKFLANVEKYNQRGLAAHFSFRREIDRLDLTQYMLTGEIRANATANSVMKNEFGISNNNVDDIGSVVGSLAMWNVPPGAPPVEGDSSLNTVEFVNVLRDYDHLDLFMIHVMKNFQRLQLLENKLVSEINYGVVKAVRGEIVNNSVNQDLLARIATMHSKTISWSNVLDHFLPEDFHDLARRCSMHGTCMHYGYSMNWPAQVFGTKMIDCCDTEVVKRKEVVDAVLVDVRGLTGMEKTYGHDPLTRLG
ncbi:hypothetical protein JG688_00001144 [Phytophthora aleatoria]|uniref:Uncharacterized protein n=1 Tax=Phytophthora aleatoria TaxID=2496075 RepID=A0A8J5M9R0_9STRA|nr:hypothetical protein JG688_00001144 [Phytophthora aleatoria]